MPLDALTLSAVLSVLVLAVVLHSLFLGVAMI